VQRGRGVAIEPRLTTARLCFAGRDVLERSLLGPFEVRFCIPGGGLHWWGLSDLDEADGNHPQPLRALGSSLHLLLDCPELWSKSSLFFLTVGPA